MIKIGKRKDLYNINHLPIPVVSEIEKIVGVLDDEYGVSRNIETDLGGYVALIENADDVEKLKNSHLDIKEDIAEWGKEITIKGEEDWIMMLFILNSDYSIVVVSKELFLREES
ncbi:hypothetical protein [Anaerovorax odorimutans]|uniref:hypothetical protein n=1 Tax=Anaerovorax odorimutans TaxID=109327 RepID=UPI000417AB87|nr:hypothetical protein [Anaerovorax odorimutans]